MEATKTIWTEEFSKPRNALRYWLQGYAESDPTFLAPVEALELGSRYHTGVRKNGKTPEFFHQICIASYLRTLHRSLRHAPETLSAALLHDICEDYGFEVSFEDVERQFGRVVADAVRKLTKKYRGESKEYEDYFGEMATCPIASVVKGADRINNVQTMIGVFDLEKQKKYLHEVDVYFLPMLKEARRRFPSQEAVYENIKLMLVSQSSLIRAAHAGAVA